MLLNFISKQLNQYLIILQQLICGSFSRSALIFYSFCLSYREQTVQLKKLQFSEHPSLFDAVQDICVIKQALIQTQTSPGQKNSPCFFKIKNSEEARSEVLFISVQLVQDMQKEMFIHIMCNWLTLFLAIGIWVCLS